MKKTNNSNSKTNIKRIARNINDNINWKVSGELAGMFRTAGAAWIVARDRISTVKVETSARLANYTKALETDRADMMKLARGERTARGAKAVRDSYNNISATVTAIREECERATALHARYEGQMLDIFARADHVYIKRTVNGFTRCDAETRGAMKVSAMFAGYLDYVFTGDKTRYRVAVWNFIQKNGFTPTTGGIEYLLAVGGTAENGGKNYVEGAKVNVRQMDKPQYAITAGGCEKFTRAMIARVVGAMNATNALPVGKLTFAYQNEV